MSDPAARRKVRRRVVWVALVLVLVVGAVTRRTLAQLASARMYLVPTASMAPALRPGDRLEADDAGGADPKRGEVWVLFGPPKLFPGGGPLVKRVIGLPGETIEVAGGQVLINGKPLNEPY